MPETYLPLVGTGQEAIEGEGDPADCGMSAIELELVALMKATDGQQRPLVVCHPILVLVAQQRCLDMALRGYTAHVNPDGDGPNILLSRAGYHLPDWWAGDLPQNRDANYIESIANGYATAAEVWAAFLHSPQHRNHVLAADAFYADQIYVGIGYLNRPTTLTKPEHFWCILSAPEP